MKKLICLSITSLFIWAANAQSNVKTEASAQVAVQSMNPVLSQVISRAEAAMGKVQSLAFTASGTGATFGQAFLPAQPWPKIMYSQFSKHYDYANSTMSEEASRSRAEVNGGGAAPLMGTGEQKTSGRMNASGGLDKEFAWNLSPVPALTPSAAPVTVATRVHDLWTSPHGALRAAAAYNAVVKKVTIDKKAMTTLAFTAPGRFAAVVYLDSKNLVVGVDSVIPSPVLGDTAVTTWYDEYKDIALPNGGSVKFPGRIRQEAAGHPVLDVLVGSVQVNTVLEATVPDAVRNFKENVAAEKVPAADANALGVWFLAGGSHNSVLIEMVDHAVLVEAPLYDGRTLAVLAKARELLPAKPLRYVINSHHHFDHAGGLRAAASQGLTLLSSSTAKPFFERALANPNRLNPDALAASPAKWSLEGVDGKRVMMSGARVVQIMEIKDSVHAQGFLMVYLPNEKILIEADAFTPGAPNSPTPAIINGNHQNLDNNMAQNGLQVARILPLHGRMVDVAELNRAVGR
jgi:glyoxylase-like metal-dependent hydrolase (beta-lactamase superfamily II)